MDSLLSHAVHLIARANETAADNGTTASTKTQSQGGILEGEDPTHYDKKNPVGRVTTKFCRMWPN